MTCPYCHVEYTEDRPCFCQPSSQQFECDSRDGEFADPHPPAGLSNPFWTTERV